MPAKPKPAPTPQPDRRITLPIPAELAEQVDAWRQAFRTEQQVELSQNEALLTLIRRGLGAERR